MKLDYWILWFEDTKSWLDPMVENLELEMEELGFRLRVESCQSGEKLGELIRDSKFDLILMDYTLKKIDGKDVHGDELIRQIRKDHDNYTEVVFYSVRSADTLRDFIFNRGKLDGVYCFNRDRFLADNIMKIVETTVKKVLDTNNMRGITMASVANCDQYVIDAVVERWSQLEGEEKDAIKKKALEKLDQGQIGLREHLADLQTKDDLRHILESHAYPSKTRFHVLNSITKSKRKCSEVGPVRKDVQNYAALLDHRNILGHARAFEKDGKTIFEGHDGVIYDAQKFKELRKDMISNEKALEALLQLIINKKLD